MPALADDRRPAFAASAALHAFVLVAGLIAWPWLNKPLHMGDVVPVTLVTSDQANMSPAIQAPTSTPAASEQPTPEASALPPAPQEAPTPAPPPTTRTPPTPKVQPQPPRPQPAPAPTPKPVMAKPAQPSFDPDALLASLDKQSKAAGARRSSAARGADRPQTAVQARVAPGAGSAISSSALSDLGSELERLWNPNCDVEAAANVVIKVTFRLDDGGRLIGAPQSSAENTTDPVVKAASDRAKRAVYEGSPFDNLPQALYGQTITVNFNAQQFCANR